MPSPYQHLLAAEALMAQAQKLLAKGRYRAADSHAGAASVLLEAASARERIIGEPEMPIQTRAQPPEWCGQCDGPDLGMRFVTVAATDGGGLKASRCPRCHPAAMASASQERSFD